MVPLLPNEALESYGAINPYKIGVFAVTIAVVSNAVVKTFIAMTTGGRAFGKLVAVSLGVSVVVGLLLAWAAAGT